MYIPAKKKALDLRKRFNLLPVFVCPTIKSSFDNVFDIDLTGYEVSAEYLTLIKEKKLSHVAWSLWDCVSLSLGVSPSTYLFCHPTNLLLRLLEFFFSL